MSQSLKGYFEAEQKRCATEAAHITDVAAAEGRGMTEAERNRVSALLAEGQGFKTRIQGIDENEQIRTVIDEMNGPVNTPNEQAPAGAKSLGDAFVKSDGYRALVAGFKGNTLGAKWTTGAIELPMEFGVKANVTEALSPIVQPQVQTGITQAAAVALRQLTVADLLMQGTTDSATVRYLLETTNTNAAAPVAEAAAKPESAITFTLVDEPVQKVATFLPVSDEMLEDVAQIRSYLDSRLRLFVQHEEENQLLNGSGTAPALRGLLNRVGIQTGTRAALGTALGETAAASTVSAAILMAMTNIRVNALVEPDAIVMHPTNWATFIAAKDANGQYYGGGPFVGPYGVGGIANNGPWGLRPVITSRIAVNTALVGAFGTMAQVFYRNALTVEASNGYNDFFQRNLTAIRAEQRLALAVYRPQAFHAITALQTA